MSQQENKASNPIEKQKEPLFTHITTSEKVTNHLANQRSFLAWVRTSLATITFGFVVETFGLNLGEWQIKVGLNGTLSIHYSTFFGVTLSILGVVMMIVALIEFLQNRRAIESKRFHPPAAFNIILAILAALIGVMMAIYLLLVGVKLVP